VAYANGSDYAKVVEKSYVEDIKDEEATIVDVKEQKYKTVEVVETDKLEQDKLAAIAGIKSTKEGIEVKTNDKIKALELMGKYLGMFVDKVETKNLNIDLTNVPDNELDAEIEKYKKLLDE